MNKDVDYDKEGAVMEVKTKFVFDNTISSVHDVW